MAVQFGRQPRYISAAARRGGIRGDQQGLLAGLVELPVNYGVGRQSYEIGDGNGWQEPRTSGRSGFLTDCIEPCKSAALAGNDWSLTCKNQRRDAAAGSTQIYCTPGFVAAVFTAILERHLAFSPVWPRPRAGPGCPVRILRLYHVSESLFSHSSGR